MPDIANTDVTYSVREQSYQPDMKKVKVVALTFGDGVLTYPAGGVPLLKGKLGLPVEIQSLTFSDSANANGFLYKYDRANEKIRIYQGDNDNVADAPLIELIGGVATPAAATVEVQAMGS